ncbi:MAG: metallophosphoesterase [Dehalobacterium sp.]
MKWGLWFFLLIFFGLYGLVNYYVGLRGWQFLFKNIPGINSSIYWVIFWFVAWSYILEHIGKRFLPTAINHILTWLGSYWLGILFFAFLIIGVLDIFRIIIKWSGFLPEAYTFFAAHSGLLAAVVLFFITALQIYGSWNALQPQVTRYEITIPKSGGNLSELHMVMVSDIHLGKIVGLKRLTKMVAMINEAQPDLVVFAGDIVDGSVDIFTEQRLDDAFKNIKSKYGAYAVLGNHEYISQEIEKTIFYLNKGGVRVLRDEVVWVADSFYLVGRDDRSARNFSGTGRKALSEIIKGVDISDPVLLLDHQPQNLGEAERLGIDLQLSGHTHKGQFFPNNLITNRIFENDWGYLRKGSLQVIVSTGFGTWGPPIRIGNRPEIVEILIRFQT